MSDADSEPSEPYVGPRPFETREKHLFFGREREAHEISSLVLANKFFVLYAASSAGKTSLVNAGVLPLMEDKLEVLPTARFQAREPHRIANAANVYTYAVLSGWAEPEITTSSPRRPSPDSSAAARGRPSPWTRRCPGC